MTDTTAEGRPGSPSPIERRRSETIRGHELEIDGQVWLLHHAGISPMLTEVRDRLYNRSLIAGKANLDDCRVVCFMALMANYHVTPEEARALIWRADPDEVVTQAFQVLFIPQYFRRNWTDWARASLIINGIDPDKVKPADVPHVLLLLIMTEKTIPAEEYTEAGEAASKFASLRQIAEEQKAGA